MQLPAILVLIIVLVLVLDPRPRSSSSFLVLVPRSSLVPVLVLILQNDSRTPCITANQLLQKHRKVQLPPPTILVLALAMNPP